MQSQGPDLTDDRLLTLEGAATMQGYLLEVAYANAFPTLERFDAVMANLMHVSQQLQDTAGALDEHAIEQRVRANVYLAGFTRRARAHLESRLARAS
jgi:hypothetical protein